MAIRIIFPSDQGADRAVALATDFVARGRIGGHPLFPHADAGQADAARSMVQPMPACDDLDALLALGGVGSSAEALLRVMMARGKQGIRRLVPPLDGDSILEEEFLALKEPFDGCPARAIAYRRQTTRGVMVIIDQATTLAQDGSLVLAPVPASPRPAAVVSSFAVAASPEVVSIIDVGSTIGQFVGFAIAASGNPLAGMALAGGSAVIGQVLTGMMSGTKSDLATDVSALVTHDLMQYDISQHVATIQTYYNWFVVRYDAVWSEGDDMGDPSDPESAYNKFIKDLDEQVDDLGALPQAVGQLQSEVLGGDPTFQQVALQPFLLGANLHMLFFKTALLLDVHSRTIYASPYLDHMVCWLGIYFGHADQIAKEIDGKVAERLAKISDVIDDTFLPPVSEPDLLPVPYSYVTDSDVTPHSSFWDGLPSNTVCSELGNATGCTYCPTYDYSTSHAACQQQRDDYVKSVTNQIREKYSYEQAEKIKQTIQDMKDNLTKYQNWQEFAKENPQAPVAIKNA